MAGSDHTLPGWSCTKVYLWLRARGGGIENLLVKLLVSGALLLVFWSQGAGGGHYIPWVVAPSTMKRGLAVVVEGTQQPGLGG